MTTSRTSSLSWRTLALAAIAFGVACVHVVCAGEKVRTRDAMATPGSMKFKAAPSPGGGGGSRSRGVSTYTSTGGSGSGVQTFTNSMAKAVRSGQARISAPPGGKGRLRSSSADTPAARSPRMRQNDGPAPRTPRMRQADGPQGGSARAPQAARTPLNSGAIVQVAQREPMVRAAIAMPQQRPAPKRNAFAIRVYSPPPADQFTAGPGSAADRPMDGSTQ